MITIARIADQVVAEAPIAVPDIDYAPPMLTWVRVPDTLVGQVVEGWTYVDGVFAAPVPVVHPEPPRYVPVSLARERLEAAGQWDALVTAMSSDMPKLIKMLTLERGLSPDDPDVHAVLTAIGADPAVVLAP